MSVKDLINAIASGSAIETEQAFNQVMAEKISARLDDMRIEVAQNMFSEDYKKKMKEEESCDEEDDMKEELNLEDFSLEELQDFMMSEDYEQLDELSKKTLGSYLKKATDQSHNHQKDVENISKMARSNRKSGNTRAADVQDKEVGAMSDKYRKSNFISTDDDNSRSSHYSNTKPSSGKRGRIGWIKTAIDKLTKEEVEQIDELSKGTMANYLVKAGKDVAKREAAKNELNKASDDIWKHTSSLGNRHLSGHTADKLAAAGHEARKELDKQYDKHSEKQWKREKGIHTAIKKLSK